MKSLKLKLKGTPKTQDFRNEEMKHFQGGMNMTWDSDLGTYVLDGVTVYGDAPGPGPQSECPQCQRWHQMNSGQPSMSGDNVTTPLGEYLINTLPHKWGWGNHQ